MRRTAYVETEFLERLRAELESEQPEHLQVHASGYVGHWIDDEEPVAGLLWVELRRIEQKSGMTKLQRIVWEWHIRGLSNRAIARVFQRDESTVRQHLAAAQEKATAVADRGLFTTMIEILGWDQVRAYLADQRSNWMLPLPKGLRPKDGRLTWTR